MGGASVGTSSSYQQSVSDMFSNAMSGSNSSSSMQSSNNALSSTQSSNMGQSSTQSSNTGQSSGSTFVDPAQAAAREDLFAQSGKYANPAMAQAQARATGDPALKGMEADFANLAGLSDPTALAAGQKKALASGLGDLFAKEINPALKGEAIAAGGFGGGRQGVAQGVATGELADAYATGSADIDAAAARTALDASAQRSALGQNMFTLGQGMSNAGLNTVGLLSNILGPATVLSQEQSRSSGSSTGSSYNSGSSTGKSTSSGKSKSKSKSKSTSKAKAGSSSSSQGASESFSAGVSIL